MNDLDNKIIDSIKQSLDSEKWENINDLNSKRAQLLKPLYEHFIKLEKKFTEEFLDIEISFDFNQDDIFLIEIKLGIFQPFSPITYIRIGYTQDNKTLKSAYFVQTITNIDVPDYLENKILKYLDKYKTDEPDFITLNSTDEVINLCDELFSKIIVNDFNVDGNVFKRINSTNLCFAFLKQIEISSNKKITVSKQGNTILVDIADEQIFHQFHISSLENGKGYKIYVSIDKLKTKNLNIDKEVDKLTNDDIFTFELVTKRLRLFTSLYELKQFKRNSLTHGFDISLNEPIDVFLIIMKIYDYCIKQNEHPLEEPKGLINELTTNKLKLELEKIAYEVYQFDYFSEVGFDQSFYKRVFEDLMKGRMIYDTKYMARYFFYNVYLRYKDFNELISYVKQYKEETNKVNKEGEKIHYKQAFICLDVMLDYCINNDYQKIAKTKLMYSAKFIYEELLKSKNPNKKRLLELL